MQHLLREVLFFCPLSLRCLSLFPFYTADNSQVEDLRSELLRTRKEKTELERARLETFQPIAQPHGNHTDREEGRGGQRVPGTECLDKQERRRQTGFGSKSQVDGWVKR